MNETRAYVRGAWLTLAVQLIMVCLAFASNVVIARTIGPSGRGVVSLAQLFPFFVAMVVALGMDEANVFFLGSSRASHGAVMANVLLVTVAGAIISFLIVVGLRSILLGSVLKNLNPSYLVFSAASIPFFLFSRLSATVFQGHRDFISFNLINLSTRLLNLLFPVLLIIVLGMGVAGGVLSVPLAVLCVSLMAGALVLRKGRPRRRPDFALLKSSLSYGLRAQPGVLMNFFDRRLDIFLINFFLNTADVGLYVIGVSMAELLWNLPNAIGLTLFPKIAASTEREGDEFTCLVARNLMFMMVVAGVILALAGKPILLLFFGDRFRPSLLPFWILLPGIVFLGMAKVMSSSFHGKGKPQYGTFITFVSVTVTIVLDIALIPKMGITGAALASTIAYTTAGSVAMFWFLRRSKVGLSELVLVRASEVAKYPAVAREALRRR